MSSPAVTHHTILKKGGGAARVATLIHKGLLSAGYDSQLSFEVDDTDGSRIMTPEHAACSIPSGRIVHLHASCNTPAFLDNISKNNKIIVTLHDLKMVTGGCPYPLDCPMFLKGCPDPCPRNFPDSMESRKRSITSLLEHHAELISPSGWLARLAKRSAPELNIKVIPNGIPWPEKQPDKKKARQQLGINPSSRMILFAAHGGTKAQYKAGHRWMNIWNNVKKQIPEAIGFICGGDKFDIEGDLHFWPYVGREKLGLLMEASDILAYPTLADNHPLVVLEAMSHGLPCVSYSTGGVPEQIQHEENGILVDCKNENKFIEEAVKMLELPGKCRSLGIKAYSDGMLKFSSDRMVSNYLKKYVKIM